MLVLLPVTQISVVVIVVLLALTAVRLITRGVANKQCARCGGQAVHGYSKRAESDLKDIESLCPPCLLSQLKGDYETYAGHAVVVQPAAGPPCYVFRPKHEWDGAIGRDLEIALQRVGGTCNSCGRPAHFYWVYSLGLNGDAYGKVFESGLLDTLFKWGNLQPLSLCGECCIKHIAQTLEQSDARYIEACGPRGSEDGLVMPMGY